MVDKEALDRCQQLFDTLWVAAAHALQSFGSIDPKQAEIADRLMPRWAAITDLVVREPKKLTYRAETGIVQRVENIDLPREQRGAPPGTLQVKYSIVQAIVDMASEDVKRPKSAQLADPQVRVTLMELYADSKRSLNSSVQGMAQMIEDPNKRWLNEATLGNQTTLNGLLARALSQTYLNVGVMGKSVYFDTDARKMNFFDLIGGWVKVGLDRRSDVVAQSRLGNMAQQEELPLKIDVRDESLNDLSKALTPFANEVRKRNR